MMMKNKDRKAKLSSAYHEFSIHRRLFWLVSFLRFAIPCCDFPHDELSWRKSWDDDLNLEVIQQLYILTASFAPEHRINIQWNQSCQHDRRHLLFSRVSNEIQGISNRIVRMRDISLLCCRDQEASIWIGPISRMAMLLTESDNWKPGNEHPNVLNDICTISVRCFCAYFRLRFLQSLFEYKIYGLNSAIDCNKMK